MGMIVPGGTRANPSAGDVRMHDNLSKIFDVLGIPKSYVGITTYDEATLATVMEASAIRIADIDGSNGRVKRYDTCIFGKGSYSRSLVKKVLTANIPELQPDGSIKNVDAIEDVKPTHLEGGIDMTKNPCSITMSGREVTFKNTGFDSTTITIGSKLSLPK
jgi:hypothetical protein